MYKLSKHQLGKLNDEPTVITSPALDFVDWGMMLAWLGETDPAALLFYASPKTNVWWSPVTNYVYTVQA